MAKKREASGSQRSNLIRILGVGDISRVSEAKAAKVSEAIFLQGRDQYFEWNSGYQLSFIDLVTLRPLTVEVNIISMEVSRWQRVWLQLVVQENST